MTNDIFRVVAANEETPLTQEIVTSHSIHIGDYVSPTENLVAQPGNIPIFTAGRGYQVTDYASTYYGEKYLGGLIVECDLPSDKASQGRMRKWIIHFGSNGWADKFTMAQRASEDKQYQQLVDIYGELPYKFLKVVDDNSGRFKFQEIQTFVIRDTGNIEQIDQISASIVKVFKVLLTMGYISMDGYKRLGITDAGKKFLGA